MKTYVLPLAAALIVAAAGTANAGKIYFTAYQDGKQAAIKADRKAKQPGAAAQIEVVTQAAYDKMSAAKKKNYTAAEMCGQKYYLSKKGSDWMKAHEGAKHEIRVRDNVKRGQYKVVCPKEAAAPPPADKKKTQ
ncbi:MAG TPA: hypothetical protein VIF14_01320 [Alphaproteobacteria bacterium]|jgi:hypothetical protein